jgi:hypothetical protein
MEARYDELPYLRHKVFHGHVIRFIDIALYDIWVKGNRSYEMRSRNSKRTRLDHN